MPPQYPALVPISLASSLKFLLRCPLQVTWDIITVQVRPFSNRLNLFGQRTDSSFFLFSVDTPSNVLGAGRLPRVDYSLDARDQEDDELYYCRDDSRQCRYPPVWWFVTSP